MFEAFKVIHRMCGKLVEICVLLEQNNNQSLKIRRFAQEFGITCNLNIFNKLISH
jgi:hypothetical protein